MSNKYLQFVDLAKKGEFDRIHMALIHDLKIPCSLKGTHVSHYEVNLRLHIFRNIQYMHNDNTKNWNSMPTPWNCEHRWIRSITWY